MRTMAPHEKNMKKERPKELRILKGAWQTLLFLVRLFLFLLRGEYSFGFTRRRRRTWMMERREKCVSNKTMQNGGPECSFLFLPMLFFHLLRKVQTL